MAFAEGYFLTKDLMDWFWKAYVPAGTDLADLRLSPLLAKDFKGLPPAFVLTAGYDPLRDEGRAYADRLIDAGIKTTYVNYPGTIHGFFSLTRFLEPGTQGERRGGGGDGGAFRDVMRTRSTNCCHRRSALSEGPLKRQQRPLAALGVT